MRAVTVRRLGSYDAACVEDAPKPVPGRGEVLIRVEAAPINFADLLQIAGKYQFQPDLPFIPGKGPVGVVEALGADVEGLTPGDRVLAMMRTGAFAQFAVASASHCYKLPATLSSAQAAVLSLAYDTAWFALRDRARIAAGETALVLGATGAVGRACLQLARAMGARTLAGVSSSERFEAAREAGADICVDLSAENLHDALRAQVYAQTNGAGADVILDMLGGDVFDAALRALAWRGRLVVVGFASGRIPMIKANYLLLKTIEVSGLQVSDYHERRPDQVADCYREIFALFKAGRLDPGPATELPLDAFKDGFHLLEERKTSGRVVLKPWA